MNSIIKMYLKLCTIPLSAVVALAASIPPNPLILQPNTRNTTVPSWPPTAHTPLRALPIIFPLNVASEQLHAHISGVIQKMWPYGVDEMTHRQAWTDLYRIYQRIPMSIEDARVKWYYTSGAAIFQVESASGVRGGVSGLVLYNLLGTILVMTGTNRVAPLEGIITKDEALNAKFNLRFAGG